MKNNPLDTLLARCCQKRHGIELLFFRHPPVLNSPGTGAASTSPAVARLTLKTNGWCDLAAWGGVVACNEPQFLGPLGCTPAKNYCDPSKRPAGAGMDCDRIELSPRLKSGGISLFLPRCTIFCLLCIVEFYADLD